MWGDKLLCYGFVVVVDFFLFLVVNEIMFVFLELVYNYEIMMVFVGGKKFDFELII